MLFCTVRDGVQGEKDTVEAEAYGASFFDPAHLEREREREIMTAEREIDHPGTLPWAHLEDTRYETRMKHI